MIFAPSSNFEIPNDFALSVRGKTLTRVNHTKFLGVLIDNKLDWSVHINDLCTSLRKFVGIFYKISFFIPEKILKILYFSMIHPKLLYAIELYANAYQISLHDLIILNNRILRICQKKDRRAITVDLYSSFNTLPIDKLFKFRILMLAHSIIYKPSSLPHIFCRNSIPNSQIHEHLTRSNHDFHRISYKNQWGRKTTENLCASYWNALPVEMKNIGSDNIFCKALKRFLLQEQ